jgi:hypothetical protein
MKFNRSLALFAVVSAALFVPAPAAAQVKVGQHIRMTTAEGLVASGQVMSLSSEEMDFKDGGGNVVKVPFGGLRRIQVVDSRANGLIGGALAGAASIAVIQVTSYYGFVAGIPVVALYGGNLKNGVIGGAIVGGLIGMAIDSRRMTTVYERTDRQIAVQLHPVMSAAGKGIGATVRW